MGCVNSEVNNEAKNLKISAATDAAVSQQGASTAPSSSSYLLDGKLPPLNSPLFTIMQLNRLKPLIGEEKDVCQSLLEALSLAVETGEAQAAEEVKRHSEAFIARHEENGRIKFLLRLSEMRADSRRVRALVEEQANSIKEGGVLQLGNMQVRMKEGRPAFEQLLKLGVWKLPQPAYSRELSTVCRDILDKLRGNEALDMRRMLFEMRKPPKGKVSVHFAQSANNVEEILGEWLVDEGFESRPNRQRLLAQQPLKCGIYAATDLICMILSD